MTNPMFNPQPNYSGVTIQIANPAVYAGQYDTKNPPFINGGQVGMNKELPNNTGNYISYPQGSYSQYANNSNIQEQTRTNGSNLPMPIQQYDTNQAQNSGYPVSYPPQYYLNNYNYNGTGGVNNGTNNDTGISKIPNENTNIENYAKDQNKNGTDNIPENNETYNNTNSYKMYAQDETKKLNDMTKSQNIIGDIAEREAKLQEEKKNTKETKIVALTDEYIKSLENYLNNPNDEIRLMASKEILTRLDEDKDRYDDAALNALLNKMLQDPNKLVRIAALSAFASQLASGNDYTVQLLHNIQSNPNADKEDVLQAADILLKMSAGVEVKNIPNPSVKEKKEK